MLPYRDDPRPGATRFPWFTILFLIINLAVFGYQVMLATTGEIDGFIERWGFYPADFWAGERLYTAVTAVFLHGGVLHIVSNMIFLGIFGPNVEDQLGRRTYFVFYLVGGVVASIAYALAFPDMDAPLVGASGAIAAVLGGYVLLFPRAMVRSLLFVGPFITAGRVAAIILIGFWFLIQVVQSVVSVLAIADTGNVAFLAHAAGFVFGIIAVGAIREARDQPVTHWGKGDEHWWNRSFRNWILLMITFGIGLVLVQFMAEAGSEALASLIQSGLLILAGLVAILDGWWRLRGYDALLGSTQRLERVVAIIQLVAGVSLLSSIFWI
ncbi:MAG: rhomboid family intramembrane serine protease [Sphaerobacteraceae bacterium]|nr:MAG: rhomboid family intramembrane serine protease [Sphaerobacteraceae bacterium]